MEIFFEPHICIHNYADLEQTKSKVEKAHYVWPYFWVANKTGANKGRSNNAQYMFFMRSFSSYHWLTVGALHQVWLNISWHYLLWFNTKQEYQIVLQSTRKDDKCWSLSFFGKVDVICVTEQKQQVMDKLVTPLTNNQLSNLWPSFLLFLKIYSNNSIGWTELHIMP